MSRLGSPRTGEYTQLFIYSYNTRYRHTANEENEKRDEDCKRIIHNGLFLREEDYYINNHLGGVLYILFHLPFPLLLFLSPSSSREHRRLGSF
jgi:hypothetical protein